MHSHITWCDPCREGNNYMNCGYIHMYMYSIPFNCFNVLLLIVSHVRNLFLCSIHSRRWVMCLRVRSLWAPWEQTSRSASLWDQWPQCTTLALPCWEGQRQTQSPTLALSWSRTPEVTLSTSRSQCKCLSALTTESRYTNCGLSAGVVILSFWISVM